MAGISFLYAVWHSVAVRSLLSLDDIDFTVLAATSVLGDLIDKCPPAEACRDAFDRMSKATIQMCMSTTGFGPQALRALPQAQPSSRSPSTAYASASDTELGSDTEMQGYPPGITGSYFAQQQQQRRPAPKFDMNLKELFDDDQTDKRSFSRVSNQVGAMRPPPPPIKPEVQQQHIPPFTTDLRISPQLRTHQQSFLSASPNFTSTTPTLSTPISQSPSSLMPSPYQSSAQLPYNAFAQNYSSTYPDLGGFSDLDFLDSVPMQGSGTQGDASGGAMQDVGIGFGMGFGDGTHDWSDGNGFDLFDGFFFGPGGTGM
jgi:hypothetical protein